MIAADMNAFIVRYHEALNAFFGGNPEPAKTLFSHKDDTTLGNPFGPFAQGWPQVEETMNRAAANYRDGGATGFETLSSCVTPNLAYLVEVERFEARIGANEGTASGGLRVTTVLRPEDGDWKIVHRHADPITTRRPAESVIQR